MALFMSIFVVIALIGFMLSCRRRPTVLTAGSSNIRIDSEHLYLVSCMTVMFAICALRDITVGVDTKIYVDSFLDDKVLLETVAGSNKFEIGYRLFIAFLRLFSNDPHVFVFASSLVMFVGTYSFIEKNCKGSYCLSLLIFSAFIYYSYFSAIRQSIAMAIAINSFGYICDRKWVKAILLIILGAVFHYTALILLAFIPLILTKWTKRKVAFALLLSVIATVFFNQIIEFIIQFFPVYGRYWNSGMMKSEETNGGSFVTLIIILSAFSLFNLTRNGNRLPTAQERTRYIVALVGTVFCVFINILGMSQGIFSRMTRYFVPFVMVLTVSTYKYYMKKFRMPYFLGVALIMGAYFYVRMDIDVYQIIPYSFFFGGK